MELLTYFDMLRLYLSARYGVEPTGRDERGSVTLEQVIITAVLCAAAAASAAIILNAINNHSANIK